MIKTCLPVAFLALLVGCASAQPNAFDRTLFHVTTQKVEVVLLRTNVTATATNIVAVPGYIEIPHYEPRQEVLSGLNAAGQATGTAFPLAAPIIGLIGAAYAAWAEIRNKQKAKLNGSLAQSLEVGRETIKAVAGEAAEQRFVDHVESNQVSSGVKDIAAKVSATTVNKLEAKAAAEDVVKPVAENKP